MKKTKFIGYCNECEMILCGKDMISTRKWECPSCGYNGFLGKIKNEKTIDSDDIEVDIDKIVEVGEIVEPVEIIDPLIPNEEDNEEE